MWLVGTVWDSTDLEQKEMIYFFGFLCKDEA